MHIYGTDLLGFHCILKVLMFHLSFYWYNFPLSCHWTSNRSRAHEGCLHPTATLDLCLCACVWQLKNEPDLFLSRPSVSLSHPVALQSHAVCHQKNLLSLSPTHHILSCFYRILPLTSPRSLYLMRKRGINMNIWTEKTSRLNSQQ